MPVLGQAKMVKEVGACHASGMICRPGPDSRSSCMASRRRSGYVISRQRACYAGNNGFTLLEILLAVAILAILASIAIVAYTGYINTARISNAENQISTMSLIIDAYHQEYKVYPASLADVGLDTLKDPWGNLYHYLNIETAGNNGNVRKDHNLVPLNTDYDLYSSGEDGQSVPPLTAAASRDDIVRANNGGFIGLGSDY